MPLTAAVVTTAEPVWILRHWDIPQNKQTTADACVPAVTRMNPANGPDPNFLPGCTTNMWTTKDMIAAGVTPLQRRTRQKLKAICLRPMEVGGDGPSGVVRERPSLLEVGRQAFSASNLGYAVLLQVGT